MKPFTSWFVVSSMVLGLTVAVAAAGPVFYNGGPTPDPAQLSKCAGTAGPVVMNDGTLAQSPALESSPMEASAAVSDTPRLSMAPVMQNGGPTPSPLAQAASPRAGWCGGSYSPERGTNFGGS